MTEDEIADIREAQLRRLTREFEKLGYPLATAREMAELQFFDRPTD